MVSKSAEGRRAKAEGQPIRPPASGLRPPFGQASLELTVAILGALLFLIAAVKVVLWSTERFVARTEDYDRTRTSAASVNASTAWDNSYEPTKKLEILK